MHIGWSAGETGRKGSVAVACCQDLSTTNHSIGLRIELPNGLQPAVRNYVNERCRCQRVFTIIRVSDWHHTTASVVPANHTNVSHAESQVLSTLLQRDSQLTDDPPVVDHPDCLMNQ